MDEALGLPTEGAARLALRTQQIIAHESGVAETVDPLAGSYTVERLTDEVEERARAYLHEIDDLGGALAAIQSGFVQREIQEASYKTQRAVEATDRVIVGVNTEEDEPSVAILQLDPEVERRQLEMLARVRQSRDEDQTRAALEKLAVAAGGVANLIPHILDCVRSDATLGEICDALRQVWGEYSPPAGI